LKADTTPIEAAGSMKMLDVGLLPIGLQPWREKEPPKKV
jgi:hypothetical protein